jgi:hypothetical protein
MKSLRARVQRDERGAALVLAIAFMLVVGGIGASLLPAINSGVNNRTQLDRARNREYAADGAIEAAIAKVRTRMTTGNEGGATLPCPLPSSPPEAFPSHTLASVAIQVTCTYVATLASGHYQRNAVFTAKCASVQTPACPDTSAVIIRAQVNFASPSILSDPSITVIRTYVQSWSVNA